MVCRIVWGLTRFVDKFKVHQPAAIMLDHDKDEQNLEERCRNREEVDGNQLFRMIV